jgi:hypothetical protein
MLRRAASGVFIAALFLALPARADPPPGPAPVAKPASTAPDTQEPSSDEEAARLFQEAEARYAEGDVPGALESMKQAYASSGHHELLFNLGELERELGHCMAARRNYSEYVTRVPDGRKRADALRKEGELRPHCPTLPRAEPATTASASSSYWTPATIAGWATIGAGVVSAAGGTYLAVRAQKDQHELEDRVNTDGAFTQSDEELMHHGERSAAWARGLFVGAGVLVAAGVTLLVLQPGSAKPATTLAVTLDTRTATAVWRGSF